MAASQTADGSETAVMERTESAEPVDQSAASDADAIVEPDRSLVCTMCGLTSCW